jgi:hypothetical protein
MRKFALAGLVMFLSVGLSLAAQVTFLSYDKEKKELKVKDGDEEKVYEITDDTKFKVTAKGEEKELDNMKGIKALERMEDGGKAKGKQKLDIEVDGKKVKELKMKLGGKKADK